MDVDALANLLFQEWFNEVDDGVNERRDVDDVNFLQLYGISLLNAHQELLDECWGKFGEVRWRCDRRVEDVNITGDASLFLDQSNITNHERQLHSIGNVVRHVLAIDSTKTNHAAAFRRESWKWRHVRDVHDLAQLRSVDVAIGEELGNRVAHRVVHVQLLLHFLQAELAAAQKRSQSTVVCKFWVASS